ncbi:MAG: replication initiation factor domain-containing protein [Crocosphaera sp.]|nr:replication initiation factor domain-containing protein [Crocosphaera sp.]
MSVSVRFDYLQGICLVDYESEIKMILDSICDLLPIGDSWSLLNRSLFLGESFTTAFCSIRGKLYGGYRRQGTGYKILLQIPGSYWSQLETINYLPLIEQLTDYGVHFTRVDIALDDYNRRIDFNSVKQVGELGHYKLVNTYKCVESSLVRGELPTPTCYFGSSDKILRFYNAEVVHGIEADRWELQLRGDHAQSVICDYLEDQNCLGEFVTGAVDFGVLSGQSWDSFKRCDWWESLRVEAGGAKKIQLPTFNPCFEKSLKWLYAQVAPTLAVAYSGYGKDGFNQLINDLVNIGNGRLKMYHHQWINELKKEHQNG